MTESSFPHLVTLEGLDALAALRPRARNVARRRRKLPHLDSLIERAADKVLTVRGESNRVNAILMTNVTFQTLHKVPTARVPDANALVKRTSCDEAVVGRDGDGRNAVLDGELKHLLVGTDIPKTHSTVTASRGNETTVAGKVQGVDVLVVAGELVPDLTGLNVPNLSRVNSRPSNE